MEDLSRKKVIKSFRLDSNVVGLLAETSKKLRTSESQYVSHVLESRLTVEPLAQNIRGISMSKFLFQSILGQMNSTGLEIVASEAARANIPFVLELLSLSRTLESIEVVMKEVLEPWGWFRIERVASATDFQIKLVHPYGLRWSLFLKSYLTSAFQIVTKRQLDVSVSERVVNIRLVADSLPISSPSYNNQTKLESLHF